MDTDELSDETYRGVILEAEEFLHEMTLHFEVLASRCHNEDEYLQQAVELIDNIRKVKRDSYWHIFFEREPTVKSVHDTLDKIEGNIGTIMKIPLANRHFSRWGVPRYVKELRKKL